MTLRFRVQFLTFVTLVAGAFIAAYVVTAAGRAIEHADARMRAKT